VLQLQRPIVIDICFGELTDKDFCGDTDICLEDFICLFYKFLSPSVLKYMAKKRFVLRPILQKVFCFDYISIYFESMSRGISYMK